MNYAPKAYQVANVAAGTELPLSSTLPPVRSAIVQALSTNAGAIYVGGSDVDATHCVSLAPGASLVLEAPGEPGAYIDLTKTYMDAATSGDKVNVIYLEKV